MPLALLHGHGSSIERRHAYISIQAHSRTLRHVVELGGRAEDGRVVGIGQVVVEARRRPRRRPPHPLLPPPSRSGRRWARRECGSGARRHRRGTEGPAPAPATPELARGAARGGARAATAHAANAERTVLRFTYLRCAAGPFV